MTYERHETHILTDKPDLIEAKLKRLRKQGWIIHRVTPGDGRTILVSDVPTSRPRRCRSCGDSGVIDHGTVYGEYDDHRYCDCDAGIRAADADRAELDAINAEAADTALSWMHPEPVLAGVDDDLDALPF